MSFLRFFVYIGNLGMKLLFIVVTVVLYRNLGFAS